MPAVTESGGVAGGGGVRTSVGTGCGACGAGPVCASSGSRGKNSEQQRDGKHIETVGRHVFYSRRLRAGRQLLTWATVLNGVTPEVGSLLVHPFARLLLAVSLATGLVAAPVASLLRAPHRITTGACRPAAAGAGTQRPVPDAGGSAAGTKPCSGPRRRIRTSPRRKRVVQAVTAGQSRCPRRILLRPRLLLRHHRS